MATFDVNGEGGLDFLLNQARYLQVLINPGDGTFGDESSTWVKGQGASRPQRYPNGDPLYNGGGIVMRDLDRDGCADILMTDTWGPNRRQSPLAYRNNGSGQFRAFRPGPVHR